MIKNVDLNIENYGISSFIYYMAKADDVVDQEQLEKLKQSETRGLLPCVVLRKWENTYMRFELLSETTLEDMIGIKLTKSKLTNLISQLLDTLQHARKNGLDPSYFIMDHKSIYFETESNRLIVPFLPIKNNSFERVSLKDFLKGLLNAAPFDVQDDILFFVKLHNYLLEADEVELSQMAQQMKALGIELDVAPVPTEFELPAAQKLEPESELARPSRERNEELVTKASHFYRPGEVENPSAEKNSSQKRPGNVVEIEEEVNYKRVTRTDLEEGGENASGGIPLLPLSLLNGESPVGTDAGTTVLSNFLYGKKEEEGGTTVLGVEASIPRLPFLLVKSSMEKVYITKNKFSIGRDPGVTDFTSQNKIVGRIHAEVLSENGEYFLKDNNSTNGSFVNNVLLRPNEKLKIRHDDRIKLGNEELVFKLF